MTSNRLVPGLVALALSVALIAGALPAGTAFGSGDVSGAGGEAATGDLASSETRTVQVQRVNGEDRIATAAQAAEAAFPGGAPTALLARADSFPDALTAATLAGVRSAPVLLTLSSRLAPRTRTSLERLGVTEVVLVGGRGALSDSLERALREDYQVRRVSGDDRYQTAANVARTALAGKPAGGTAILANGLNYPDALAAGSLAFHRQLPVLLTGSQRLHDAAGAALRDLGIGKVIVVGGPSAVSGAVTDDLKRRGIAVTRIGGSTRLETARLLADHAIKEWDLSARAPVIVRGDNFPDALVAGSYAGSFGTPTLLTAGTHTLGFPAADWLARHCDDVEAVHTLGGEAAVSTGVLHAARNAAQTCSAGERRDGGLRDGIGGESRPTGNEYTIPPGYPHGGNTGVIGAGLDYSALKVHQGDLTVTTHGAVVQNLDIRGTLTIRANNVTVRRVRVRANTSLYALDWRGDSSWQGVTGLLVEDTEIFNESNGGRAVGGAGQGTFRRINAYGGATVFYASSGARVEDSFLHDPLTVAGGHHDSIQSSGGTGPEVVRSTVLGRYRAQTSALILQSNFSAKSNVVLQDNFLAGGNYTIYISAKDGMPHPANVTVTGNLWQEGSWQFGPARTKVGSNWTWENNRTTTGRRVNP